MGKVTRKRHTAEFKARAALEAIKGEQTCRCRPLAPYIGHLEVAEHDDGGDRDNGDERRRNRGGEARQQQHDRDCEGKQRIDHPSLVDNMLYLSEEY